MVLKVKGLIFCLLEIHESPSFNVLSALTAINDGLRLERDVVSERIGRNNAYFGARVSNVPMKSGVMAMS